VEEKFHDLITALYGGAVDIYTETEVTYEDGRKGRIKATLAICDAQVAAEQYKVAAE
jgi:long-chain acyl-CoA synthetase